MPEWTNGADSKSVVLLMRDRGFESLFLRNKTNAPIRESVFVAGYPSRDHDCRE
jgi:hypothetical protein